MTTVANLLGSVQLALAPSYMGMMAREMPAEAPMAAGPGEVTIERGQRFAVKNGIAVVPVRGLLTPNFYLFERYFGWATYHGIEATMDELVASEDVTAIVLEIDSPGGMVLGVDGAGQAIARAAAQKPVRALVHPLAASAAYWLASQASDITITPGSWVGSIGTVVSAWSRTKADQNGDRWFDMVSSHARAKLPDPAEDRGAQLIQMSLDKFEGEFLAAVAAGRGLDLEALPGILSVTDDPADGGEVFGPEDAAGRHLVDRTATRSAFYAMITAEHAIKPRARGRGAGASAIASAAVAIAGT